MSGNGRWHSNLRVVRSYRLAGGTSWRKSAFPRVGPAFVDRGFPEVTLKRRLAGLFFGGSLDASGRVFAIREFFRRMRLCGCLWIGRPNSLRIDGVTASGPFVGRGVKVVRVCQSYCVPVGFSPESSLLQPRVMDLSRVAGLALPILKLRVERHLGKHAS